MEDKVVYLREISHEDENRLELVQDCVLLELGVLNLRDLLLDGYPVIICIVHLFG